MFTKKARAKTAPYWEGSFHHPFVKGIKDGSLSEESFRYYLIQDGYYLEHFSYLHELVAEKATDPEVKAMLLNEARHLKEGEISIREGFFNDWGISPEEVAATDIAPTAYNYVSHMYRQIAEGSVNSAVAGLLPCPWLYQEIGYDFIKTGSPNPMYQRWIETYAGEEAEEEVARQCAIVNRLYEESDETEKEKMIESFYISAQMEYLFWEMSYTHQTWPEGDKDAISTH